MLLTIWIVVVWNWCFQRHVPKVRVQVGSQQTIWVSERCFWTDPPNSYNCWFPACEHKCPMDKEPLQKIGAISFQGANRSQQDLFPGLYTGLERIKWWHGCSLLQFQLASTTYQELLYTRETMRTKKGHSLPLQSLCPSVLWISPDAVSPYLSLVKNHQ